MSVAGQQEADTIREALTYYTGAAERHSPTPAREALAALSGLLEQLHTADSRALRAEDRVDELDEFATKISSRAVAAEARLQRQEEALREIAANAEDWHGPPPDMGHVRALAVIATRARSVLGEPAGTT